MRFDEETGSYVIESPLSVPVSSKKKFMLNMNDYRNAHYQVLNKAKVEYKRIMRDEILQLPKMNVISVDYEITLGDNRRHDGMNIASVTSKFFLDALVEYGILEDDNMKRVLHEEWNSCGVEKGNGRVLIYIRPL